MKIVQPTEYGLRKAADVMRRGGVVVFPTDTAYGLGGIFNNKDVVQKILKIKQRTDTKFTLVASSLAQVERFFKLTQQQKSFAQYCWPGPISLVVSNKFSVRVPDNYVARSLVHRVGIPLIATSANVSSKKTPAEIKDIFGQFEKQKHQPDILVDAGKVLTSRPSSIVLIDKNNFKVIREGAGGNSLKAWNSGKR